LTREKRRKEFKKLIASTYDKSSTAFLALARCAMLCNRADFKRDSENLARSVLEREYIGDTPEVALLKYMELSVRRFSFIDYSFIIFYLYRLVM
jgi:hypothetical protein